MKGWLDNFGKADNANDSNVSLPEGFVGLGYNTKGRNYSPAWGGQFQKGGKLTPVSPMEQITGQAPSAISPTVPYLKTKDPVEFYQSWIQSPEYERRQLLTGYSPSAKDESLFVPSAAASRQTRLESLQNIDPITYSTRQPSESRPGVYGSSSTVNINPLDYIDTNRGMVEAHELAHIAGAMESEGTTRPGVMSGKEQEIFKKSMLPMKEPVLSGPQGSQQREASKRALEDFEHSQKPKELKADLDALRFTMYDKGIYDITKGQKFTESDFEKAKQNLGKDRVFKRLENRVGKKNFVNLMNTIAKADEEELPMAMGGMSIPGSVGFTYARTAGSAPSKGKYAKKTMASAQIGKNIEKDATNLAASNKIAQLQLLESPEYQYQKYLESLPQLRQAPGLGEKALRAADIATDVMQLGNFIPNPIAQAIAKVGNVAGTAIDAYQAASDVYKGDYTSAGLNAASAVLPSVLGANTFRRNSKYLQPGQPLYPLSPQARGSFDRVKYIEPFTKVKGMTNSSLMANRALLGILGAETAYDAGVIGPVKKEYGGEIPSAQKGDNIERISINDPRYPELYKNRQVGTYYDGAFTLPDLPEVTVTAPRSYTMDSLRDFTTAALYGAPATAMKLEQIPTAVLAETVAMLTGKPYDFSNVNPNFGQFGSSQRDLSDVLGYENPEGFLQNAANIGLSAIDPTLIGGGSKLVGKQLGKNLTKQVGEVVNRSITPIGYDPFTVLASPAELLTPNFLKFKPKTHATKNRLDAWRLYNGLEPNYNTFSKNADNTLAINDFRIGKEDLQSIVDNPKSSFGTMEVRPEFNFGAVHGNGWITKGVDEQGRKFVDFTDTWDLQPLQPIKGLPKKLKEFEVSSLTGGAPFDLKNRIYYDDAGNFFDHNNNKLIEKVQSFPKGVAKENEAVDAVMLSTPKIADEKQMDVLKDWNNAQNNKYFKGAGVAGAGIIGGSSYMRKKAKEKEKSEESKNEVPKKQNGGEMKFYQNGFDWKPKSMQEGGKIYEGQELPEFVVEGKDERMKEAMSQGIRKFYGHVGELMGAPQKEMMQLITGKEQTPSQAWGFQNTGGWLDSYSSFGKNLSNSGLDALIDPVNAVPGVGLVDDLTRGAVRGAAQDAVSKTLKYGVSPYSYSPEVLAMIPENLVRGALGKPKRFPTIVTESTAKDPNIKRTIEDTFNNREDAWSVYLGLPPENKGLRLVGSDDATGLSKYELTKPRVMNVEDVKNYRKVIDSSTIKRNDQYEKLNLYKPGDTVVDNDKLFGVMGGYSKFVSPDGKSIMYRDVWDLQPFSRLNSRELPTDFLGNAIRNFEASSLIPGAKPFVSEGKLADIKTKYYPAKPYKDIKTRFNEQLGYVRNYYEPEAYIRDIDNPTAEEIFNYDQMLRDVAKKSLMQRIKNEKTFLNPLRNQDSRKYADFAPYIKVDKSKKKDGGIIKDNEGYWNPDNWGKPVEIDSNDITMEGVYEPLLGVSDTGDTKLMKPGKNYKFKGKKVTEYPVAKLGINQLDAQPMKKLNQLLNFTNNPDKDNWLDKYN